MESKVLRRSLLFSFAKILSSRRLIICFFCTFSIESFLLRDFTSRLTSTYSSSMSSDESISVITGSSSGDSFSNSGILELSLDKVFPLLVILLYTACYECCFEMRYII